MAKETEAQRETIDRVMHEFKHGDLTTGAGQKVRSRRQALAIGLSEAGASNQQTPAENRKRLRETKARERKGEPPGQADEGRGPTRAALYAQAKRQDIPGRSKMSKAELERAVKG